MNLAAQIRASHDRAQTLLDQVRYLEGARWLAERRLRLAVIELKHTIAGAAQ